MRLARSSVTVAALAVAGATMLAACSGGSSSKATSGTPSTALGGAFGSIPAAAAGPQHTGTVTWAEAPGTAPTWILPLVSSAADSDNDINFFEEQMWRPL